jgi:uncharacterized protein (TIGR02217 family)
MSQAVFPTLPGLKFGVRRSPTFSTNIKTSVSGREYRAANMAAPRYHYRLAFEFLRDQRAGLDELRTLVGFFNARQGAFDSFLFADPDDYSVTTESFGTGNGSATAFQLYRTWSGYSESIYNLNSAPQIRKAGVLQTLTTHYTISSTGLVTFVTAPANGAALTWTGTFYRRVRFKQDALDVEKFMRDLWELKQLEFVTDEP